jgi:hypothetical protein
MQLKTVSSALNEHDGVGQAGRAQALGLAADAIVPDPLLTGVAVLTLLSDLSEQSPVLVVADDAHWLDRSTLDTLAFVGSRRKVSRACVSTGLASCWRGQPQKCVL